jgi:hypothetical protein
MSQKGDERARQYREVAEAYLGGRKVEAAGVFHREATSMEPGYGVLTRLFERLTREGPVSDLPEEFLLAVAQERGFRSCRRRDSNPRHADYDRLDAGV